jgi:transposase
MIRFSFIARRNEMARAYSLDLRRRVIDAVEGGMSTVGSWFRRWRGDGRLEPGRLELGRLEPGRQGQPRGSKLDAHEGFIFGLVEERKDISLDEIAARPGDECGLHAAPSTVWLFFSNRGITFKKRQRTLPGNSARMFSPDAEHGSTDNLPAHKISGAREAIEAAGARLLYLPPCSPDFNPIELALSKLKALIQKQAPRTVTALRETIGVLINEFQHQECKNYFTAAGYDLN